MPCYDRQLVDAIAATSGIDAELLARLDEQAQLHWTQWLHGFQSLHRLEQAQYYRHLVNLCLNILHQSGGVIVGRGAHIILCQPPRVPAAPGRLAGSLRGTDLPARERIRIQCRPRKGCQGQRRQTTVYLGLFSAAG